MRGRRARAQCLPAATSPVATTAAAAEAGSRVDPGLQLNSLHFEFSDSQADKSYITRVSFQPGDDIAAAVAKCREGSRGVTETLAGDAAVAKLLTMGDWQPTSKGSCKCSSIAQFSKLVEALAAARDAGTLDVKGLHYEHTGSGLDEVEMYAFVICDEHLLTVWHGKQSA